MALAAGDRLGPYELLSRIGEGAMGEVWKSRDSRLNRIVALKVAKEQFTDRFEREARAVAALNHSGICTLHDIGPNYLVMEYLEGETLAHRLQRGRLPLEEAVKYGSQICDALAAAHARGIIHRDLKPSNIIVTNGSAKILDFGLAKSVREQEEGPLAETLTASRALVGTPAYMSPEQITGGVADTRTDIFAFGLVFYEMLAGRRAFDAQDSTGLARQILVEQVPVPGEHVPGTLRHVLERCLAKDPLNRWQTARDVKLELEWAATTPDAAPAATLRWRPTLFVLLAAILAALAIGLPFALRRKQPADSTQTFTPFAMEAGRETDPAWSPDGRALAYAASVQGVTQILIKTIGAHTATQVTRQPKDCVKPFWSADGRQIYFISGQAIWKVGAAGGEAKLLLRPAIQTGSVSPNGTLAFIRGLGGAMSLWTANADGSGERIYRHTAFPNSFARCWTISFSRDGSKLAVLMERATSSGFFTELWIVPFSGGTPERVLEDLPFRVSSSNPGGSPQRRVSWFPDQKRLLVDGELEGNTGIQLYVIDLDTRKLIPFTSGIAHARTATVSPDGESVAFVSGGDDFDIFQVSMDGTEANPFLRTASREHDPAWAPNGRQIAYVSQGGAGGIWLRSVQDEFAIPVLLRGVQGVQPWSSLGQIEFSPRGDRIAFDSIGRKHMIWICPSQGGTPVALDADSIDQHGASWSPDGNWVAYLRFSEGQWDVVKAPVGGGSPVVLAKSVGYGSKTAWSPDGKWIAFLAGLNLSVISGDGAVRVLRQGAGVPGFDFSRDSSRLYSIERLEDKTWTMVTFETATGKEHSRFRIPVNPEKPLAGFNLHPDGKSFLTSVGDNESDIWIVGRARRSLPALR